MISRELYYYTVYDKNGNVSGHINNKIQTRFGLGAATGFKFLTKNGIVGEAYLGVGGLYGSSKIDNYLRSGVTIGKRF